MTSSHKQLIWISSALLLAVIAPLLLHADRFHRSRPRQLNGIPRHDYQWGDRSPSQQATARGLLLETDLAKRAATMLTKLQAARAARAAADAAKLAAKQAQQAADNNDDNNGDNNGESDNDGGDSDNGEGLNTFAANRFLVAAQAPVTPQIDELLPPAAQPNGQATPADLLATQLQLQALQAMSSFSPEDKIRVFQLDRAQLAIDHCMISNVAVQLHRRGCWVLSLRADQNPILEQEEAQRLTFRPRLHLKRNEFHVRMRCYGMYTGATAPRSLQAGRPLLVDLHPAKFWVQRQEPRHVRITCCDHRLAQYFDVIDRMEVEFYYR